jgi:hypothetical protein
VAARRLGFAEFSRQPSRSGRNSGVSADLSLGTREERKTLLSHKSSWPWGEGRAGAIGGARGDSSRHLRIARITSGFHEKAFQPGRHLSHLLGSPQIRLDLSLALDPRNLAGSI